MINVSPYTPTFRCPLLIGPDDNLEWSTRKPWILPLATDDKYHVTRDGDKLTLLAYRYYQDFRLWWVIYDNNLTTLTQHPMVVPAGVSLRIPALSRVHAELTHGLT